MSDDLTPRIEALEAKGYELPSVTVDGRRLPPSSEHLLTALEQAAERIVDSQPVYVDNMYQAIGTARLNIAEQEARGWAESFKMAESAIENLLDEAENAKQESAKWVERDHDDCERAEQAQQRIAKLEAAPTPTNAELRRRLLIEAGRADKAEADLVTERAKRCATCRWWRSMVAFPEWGFCHEVASESTSSQTKDDFSCSEWEPRQ